MYEHRTISKTRTDILVSNVSRWLTKHSSHINNLHAFKGIKITDLNRLTPTGHASHMW